jgi:hypothetical protein
MKSRIVLNADIQEEMHWQEQLLGARQLKQLGQTITWELDFGLASSSIALDDPAVFLSFSLALEHFVKMFECEFAACSVGVILYRGGLDLYERIVLSGNLTDHYEEWLKEMKADDILHYRRLFCIHVFAEYLHRLASFLPDSFAPPICSFEIPSSMSHCTQAQLLSKERFAHIVLEPALDRREALIGIVLPPDDRCTLKVLQQLDETIALYEQGNLFFRIIPEALLNEEWQGLETLVAIDSLLTAAGRRMLQGFIAAGGNVELVQ